MGRGPAGPGARRGLALLVAALILPLLLISTPPAPLHAQSSRVYAWDRYNVDLTINPDGSFDGVETQVFNYQAGTFRGASRSWATDRLGAITEVQVSEGDTPYTLYTGPYNLNSTASLPPPGTFITHPGGAGFEVAWFYDPVTAPATRTFTLRYHITDAIRVYPGGDQLWWNPIIAERQADITGSQIIIHLPAGANPGNVQTQVIFPKGTHTSVSEAGLVTIATDGPIRQSDPAPEVRVQWPHGLIAAAPPPWQAVDDAERARQEQARLDAERRVAFVDLGILVGSALLVVLGGLYWLVRWYRSGRDAPTALAADYLTTPPSDLPPGLVGVLVDEVADTRDVVATILDLGRQGHILIKETKVNAFGEPAEGADYKYSLRDRNVARSFEGLLLDEMFGSGKKVLFSSLALSLPARLPAIYGEMYAALVDLKYFNNRPDQVRADSFRLARRFLLLALLALLITGGMAIFGGFGLWPLVLPLALAVVGGIGLAFTRALPRRTAFGAAEAAKWLAFGRYLKNTAQYTGVEEAAKQRDQYLPYAVALGADEDLVRQFQAQSIAIASPGWFIPWQADVASTGALDLDPTTQERGLRVPDLSGIFSGSSNASDYERGDSGSGGWNWGSGGGSSGPGFHWSDAEDGGSAPGTVESWNRGLSASVESTNTGLADMISIVADALFSGSGGGGGGSSSSSSFGSSSSSSSSGSSFSGGGSSGGSGGGGSGGAF